MRKESTSVWGPRKRIAQQQQRPLAPTTTAPAIAILITRAATTSITASFFVQTMGSLGWDQLHPQCRSNVTCGWDQLHPQCRSSAMGRDPDAGPLGPLEGGVDMQVTLLSWSFELQRSCLISNPDFGPLEEVLIEDDCQRCQRKFWRQMQFAFLCCPTCRKFVSKEEPEAEADPKWQRTRRWSWACRACNTKNWPSRIRCRTCKTPKSLEPAWLDLRQKECARIAPLTIANAAPSTWEAPVGRRVVLEIASF